MKPRQLRAAILDELALAWLEVPDRGFDPARFMATHNVRPLLVGRALVKLREGGVVLVGRVEGRRDMAHVVLTRAGRAEWIRDRAESCLPEVRSQVWRIYRYLHDHPSLTARGVRVYLSVTPLRAHQVVRVMRSLELVEVDEDAAGMLTVVRLAPQRQLPWSDLHGTLEKLV